MPLLANTVHLVALNEDNTPAHGDEAGIGSGCILRCGARFALLGTRHVTDNQLRWSVQIRYVQGNGMCSLLLGAPTYIEKFTFAEALLHDLDFFILPVEFPEMPMHQDWQGFDVLVHEEPKRVFDYDEIVEPAPDGEFSFAGLVQPLLLEGPNHAIFETHPTEQIG